MPAAIMAHPDLRHPFSRAEVGGKTTVLYNNRLIEIASTLPEPGLWVTADDLTRINGFVMKPEGACLGDLCIPIRADSPAMKRTSSADWISLAALADLLEQAYVVDESTSTWSFGEIPAKRQSMMTEALAPDFELPDRSGKVIRMADYKGKKALIITWSSW